MEDTCYTNFRPRKDQRRHKPIFQWQGIQASSRWYKITLGILSACCVILGSGVIMLGIFGRNQTSRLPECSILFEDIVTHLKHSLCELPTENTECKLCPIEWKPEKGKCYWFSKETKNWFEALDSCSRKNAHMIVFQDLEELNFIRNIIQGNYRFWVGLNFTSAWKNWTWIDGSLLNQTLFPVSLPKDGHRCGVLKVNQVLSEMCTDQFKWICEKDAVLIEHTALKRGLF
ncbi:killer cell lectin-like receptor subfamily F member 2 isoform X2 [Heteronotia binoei]|uniref:killer cell lectin-like receptor subfamily F member 2 isoform X2 n=1 Tax=Heteronotia binoei TaxID=13085 RepID=UPI00292F3915|nr:killer cell lectin-like receptor subfamily F member 2 isoform X2 [Heteronotia binoei]